MEDESLNGSFHHLQHHHHHHVQHRHVSSSVGDDGGEDEELDPRIQIELEKLNRATEEINRLELELDDARASFRQVLSDSSQRLNGLAKKLGTSVDKARPYYDARVKLKEAHLESQKAALRFERACSMHEAAKEMVQLAEEGYKRREEDLDPTWQEMLNHATMKVNDAERERIESEDNHQSTTLNFKKREEEVQKLQRDLKRAITKSKPYFEMKAKFNQVMEDHKRNVSRLEEDVASTKSLYSEALRNLEAISDDIHRQRLERRQKMQLGIRGAGVGAESPSPPPSWDKGINIDGSASHVINSDGEEMYGERTGRKRWKEQGIVGFDLPLCHQSSVSDDHDLDSLKSDPLNLVMFKMDTQHHSSSTSPYDNNNFQPPSVIRHDPKHARNHSYRRALDSDNDFGDEYTQQMKDTSTSQDSKVQNNNTSSLPANTFSSSSSASKSQQLKKEMEALQSSLSRAQEWVNKSPVPQQRRFIKSKSLIDAASASSTSPSSSTVTNSSSCIGDNTNGKPPASSSSSSHHPQSSHPAVTLTSSLTTEAMRIMASNSRLQEEKSNASQSSPPHPQTSNTKVSSALSARLLQQQQDSSSLSLSSKATALKRSGDAENISVQIQPHLQQPSPPLPGHPPHHPKSSPRSVSSTTSDQSSPNSGSPSGKSPKLQGLILRVDAAGIIASPSPSSSSSPANNHFFSKHHITSPSYNSNQVVITTKTPGLGVQIQNSAADRHHHHHHHHNQQQQQQQFRGAVATNLSAPHKSTISSSSPSSASHTNPLDGTVSSTSPSSTMNPLNTTTPSPPRPSLIPYTRSLSSSSTLSLGGFKLPTSLTSSKAPQTSTAFHLPSPTQPRSTNLSIPPPLAIRQLISPTPPSPSGDRVSILSGRSDSSRGGLLRPPSDSSDTESIASTGPMLDDDQVEFLTLDFNEQSISSSAPQEEVEEGDMNDVDPSRLQRGNWSRMSLPPRLSYLGGYLERTRQAVGPVDPLVGSDNVCGPSVDVGADCRNVTVVDNDKCGRVVGFHDDSTSPHCSDDLGMSVELDKGEMGDASVVVEEHERRCEQVADVDGMREERYINVEGEDDNNNNNNNNDDGLSVLQNEKKVECEVSVSIRVHLEGENEKEEEEEEEIVEGEGGLGEKSEESCVSTGESTSSCQTETEAIIVLTEEGMEVVDGVVEDSTES